MLPRTLFYALVAVNIVLALLLSLPFFGIVPLGSATGEPERLKKQLAPEMIRVLPPSAEQSKPEPIAPPPVQEEPPALEKPKEEASSPVAENKAQEDSENRCVLIKALQDELASSLSARARKFGKLKLSTSSSTGNTSYWVHIPPDGGREAAERRIEILERNGFSDHFIVRESGDNQNAVSLGLYRTEELAKKRLEALQKAGIKTARITTRGNSLQRFEIKGPKKSIDLFLSGLPQLNKGKPVPHEDCRAD